MYMTKKDAMKKINIKDISIGNYRKWLGKKHGQPERLSEKTYYRNDDGTYPELEPCIGCDSLNMTNKEMS